MITKEQFQASILPFTLRFEGGYVNDKADRGGETYRGISRKINPTWDGWPTIDEYKVSGSLKRGDIINNAKLKDSVANFYFEKYLRANHLDNLDSVLVALVCFDFAVHGGFSTLLLQRLINRKFNGKLYDDGIWGSNTKNAANAIGEKELSLAILDVRKQRFANIIENDPTQERFRDGWNNRIEYLKELVRVNTGKA